MGLQSDVIGFRFGFGYEKGKRTLRAMSNEQFNSLNEEAESKIYKEHDTTAINFFKLEIQTWTDLQRIIIEKSVEIEKMKAERTPSATAEIITKFYDGVRNLGAQSGTNGFTWQRLASLLFPFLFSNQEHEHPENTPIPDAPTGGRSPGSPDTRQPDTPEEIPDVPKDTPDVPETKPDIPETTPDRPAAPKPVPDSPSKNIFFTLKIWEYNASNKPSFLQQSTRTFNYFQWGQAVTAYILTNHYLITSGRHGNDGRATGIYLYKQLRDSYLKKIEAFYKLQLTINTEWKDY